MSDFRVKNHGSVYILQALNEEADKWVKKWLPEEQSEWVEGSVAVEHRYVSDIIEAILEDGLSISRRGGEPAAPSTGPDTTPDQGG